MMAVKKINNNVVLCKDNNGRELIALGKGLGFGEFPRVITLDKIDRTFYDVQEHYLSLIRELSPELIGLSAKIVDLARKELPYELSPNQAFSLADHIGFAIERARKKMKIQMPLAYDIEQLYPLEYKIGLYAVRQILKKYHVGLPAAEAVGIAMNLINGRIVPGENPVEENVMQDAEMLENITAIIEKELHFSIKKDSFHYSRYATHLLYLFKRIHSGNEINTDNLKMYETLKAEFADVSQCVEKICKHIQQEWNCSITEEERMYLIMHINRIYTKKKVE